MLKKKYLLDESVQAVLFDHDDTLVETIRSKWAQHKYIAKHFYDKKLRDEELKQHWGKPLTVLIRLLYETENIDMAMSYNIATRKKFPKILFKDTLETIYALKKAGKKIGLVTATTQSSLDNDFATLKISKDLFDYIQTEDDTIFHKPDPRVFNPAVEWLKKQGITSDRTVYVGDSLFDMKAAVSAGFIFVGVGTGLMGVEEFAQHHEKVIPKLSWLVGKD